MYHLCQPINILSGWLSSPMVEYRKSAAVENYRSFQMNNIYFTWLSSVVDEQNYLYRMILFCSSFCLKQTYIIKSKNSYFSLPIFHGSGWMKNRLRKITNRQQCKKCDTSADKSVILFMGTLSHFLPCKKCKSSHAICARNNNS
jgi:hypothetical protein